MGSREWRDACRARLAARISVVDAYISIASSTSRRSNSALSVHPPHPTAAPWVAAIHSALLYRSLRSSPRHDRRCERTGSECTCDMWLVYVGVRETRCVRRYDRFVSSMNFGLDKTRLCAFASKLARDGKYTDRFKFLGLRPDRVSSSLHNESMPSLSDVDAFRYFISSHSRLNKSNRFISNNYATRSFVN